LAEECYNKGIDYFDQGSLDSSLRMFNESIRLGFKRADTWYNRGVVKAELKDYTGAIDDLDEVLNQGPSVRATFLRGQCYLALGRKEEALQDFLAVMAHDPTWQEAFYLTGTLVYTKGDYPGAVDLFTKAITLRNDDSYAYHDRGCAYLNLGMLSEAENDLQKACLLNPALFTAFVFLGETRLKLGNFSDAEEDFTAAVRVNPELYGAFNSRGLARYNLGDFRSAEEDFSKALQLRDGFTEALVNRGNARYKLQNYSGAVADYDQAIAAHPDNGTAYLNRGISREMLRDEAGACSDWDKARTLGAAVPEEFFKFCE
jgi:tetratricopeptide (TPR) repeat protein